jgi:sterol desaturase/sphingolipid hydroxylase (fatty acid hydroxylase superfamily)
MLQAGLVISGLVVGFVLGTLGEYWIHRGMHNRGVPRFLVKRHGDHHVEGVGQGVLQEFRDYAAGALITSAIFLPLDYYFLTGGWLIGGLVAGVAVHAIFAAWCHQAQHEDPRLLPWQSATPVHFVHHKRNQPAHNFGISVDWWDRVFGTYKLEPNWRALMDPNAPRRPWWKLDWADHRPPPPPVRGRRA